MKSYWINHYFPRMLADSIQQMPTVAKLLDAASKAGFVLSATEPYFVQNNLRDLFLYAGKNRPTLYFDPLVRAGISSFAALANRDEIEVGLTNLKTDLKTGNFDRVKNAYSDFNGDYSFVVFNKSPVLFSLGDHHHVK